MIGLSGSDGGPGFKEVGLSGSGGNGFNKIGLSGSDDNGFRMIVIRNSCRSCTRSDGTGNFF